MLIKELNQFQLGRESLVLALTVALCLSPRESTGRDLDLWTLTSIQAVLNIERGYRSRVDVDRGCIGYERYSGFTGAIASAGFLIRGMYRPACTCRRRIEAERDMITHPEREREERERGERERESEREREK